jgi:acyl-[acyl carrier protein]--UDP-N-acetylglucosamine O-acyltransferase
MTKPLILFACGSPLIVEYEELCLKNAIPLHAIVNNVDAPAAHPDAIPLAQFDIAAAQSAAFLVPLFTPRNRFTAVQQALQLGLTPYGLLSDRLNDLPTVFAHGVGCIINKRVVIGAHSQLGDFVTINRAAALGHHFVAEDFVSIAPGVVTGGNVTVKRGALVGTGAVILPGKTIGQHAIVSAGAVVTKDVPDFAVVAGNPARRFKTNSHDF